MPLQTNSSKAIATQKLVFLSLLLGSALVLSYIENILPINLGLQGVKLGLANSVTLTLLVVWGKREALIVLALRIIMSAVFIGNLVNFGFSLAGGLLSIAAMILVMKIAKGSISIVGISVIGAVSHNIGQLTLLSYVTKNIGVSLSYFPVLLVSGVITGIFIGVISTYLIWYVKRLTANNPRMH